MASSLVRQALNSSRASPILRQQAVRAFSTSRSSQKDLVQQIYLKELKAYKPPPAAKDAHVDAVKPFSPPPQPKAPALPSDLASELAAWDASEPALAEVTKAKAADADEHGGAGAEAFLQFLEQDLPKAEAAH